MDIGFSRWERRDEADRNELALAALEYCRAMRAEEGVGEARFYWSGVDQLSVLAHVATADVLNRLASPRFARASFGLADLARQTESEVWLDAATGEAMYHAAQE